MTLCHEPSESEWWCRRYVESSWWNELRKCLYFPNQGSAPTKTSIVFHLCGTDIILGCRVGKINRQFQINLMFIMIVMMTMTSMMMRMMLMMMGAQWIDTIKWNCQVFPISTRSLHPTGCRSVNNQIIIFQKRLFKSWHPENIPIYSWFF